MNLLGTQYSVINKSFEIYLAGCKASPHCSECHNPESWDFKIGDLIDPLLVSKILFKIKKFDSLISRVFILGGEPLDQPREELIDLLVKLKSSGKELWVFTRYELFESLHITPYVDFIKCGKHIPELITDTNIQYGVKLSSSNQYIIPTSSFLYESPLNEKISD